MKENLNIKVEAPIYTVVADVTFAQVDAWFEHTRRDLKMDIIYPEDKTRKYPCIVWICGGAWVRSGECGVSYYQRREIPVSADGCEGGNPLSESTQ